MTIQVKVKAEVEIEDENIQDGIAKNMERKQLNPKPDVGKRERMNRNLKENLRNIPTVSDDNPDESESEVEIEEENPQDDNFTRKRASTPNEVYVNDAGELVIPEYLEAEINDEGRPPIINWPREMDFKMLHYLKNMPQTHIARNKWQWLARKLSEYGVTNEEVRIHVRY